MQDSSETARPGYVQTATGLASHLCRMAGWLSPAGWLIPCCFCVMRAFRVSRGSEVSSASYRSLYYVPNFPRDQCCSTCAVSPPWLPH
eukprot:7165898-Pyramimonas_sp.AAC.1